MILRVFFIFFLFLSSCRGRLHTKVNMNKSIVSFVKNGDYEYSLEKEVLPKAISDTLVFMNGAGFCLGNKIDSLFINLSDASDEHSFYNSALNFIMYNDREYLIVYSKGGIGVSSIVDYFSLSDQIVHKRYVTEKLVTDTIKLKEFLGIN